MRELRPQFPLSGLLKVAGLARSTFYYQCQAMRAPERHAARKEQIRTIFDAHAGRYGYRRITLTLRREGDPVNAKTVQRLMQQMKLFSLVRPKKYRAYRGRVGAIAADRLQRKFHATRPHQKWVTDITEFAVGGEKLYLSPMMDLYNREVIAYTMARRPEFALVRNMLSRAIERLGPNEKPIVHSDQGWHYQMSAYQKALSDKNLTQSMSRKGNCLDNAAMESFFATLKSECYYLQKFKTIEQLESELNTYIHYYNHNRIKIKLNGLTPIEYRNQAKLC